MATGFSVPAEGLELRPAPHDGEAKILKVTDGLRLYLGMGMSMSWTGKQPKRNIKPGSQLYLAALPIRRRLNIQVYSPQSVDEIAGELGLAHERGACIVSGFNERAAFMGRDKDDFGPAFHVP